MKKNYTINLFKIIATFCVVGIHCFEFYDIERYIYVLLRSLFNFAVPFFFISSGYFMSINLDKRESETKKFQYFKKYIMKYLSIYLVFALIDGCLMIIEGSYLSGEDFPFCYWFFNKKTLLGLNTGGYFYQTWFLVALIFSHIIIYLFRNKLKELNLFSFVLYIVLAIFQITGRMEVSRTVLTLGLFYTSTGYIIAQNYQSILNYINSKKDSYLITVLFLLFVLLYLEVYLTHVNFNNILASNIMLAFFVPLLFLMCLKHPNLLKNNDTFQAISKNTFGVYLVHSCFLRYVSWTIYYLELNRLFITNIFVFIIYIAIIYMISNYIYVGFKFIINNIIKRIKRIVF